MQRPTENAASLGGEWAKLWFDMLSPMMPWMQPLTWEGTLPEMGRQMKSAQLKWWTDYLGQFLRSPDFLEAIRNSMTAMVKSRKDVNDWLGEARHAAQGVTSEDVDHLERMLRRHEEQLSAGLRKIHRRLEDLSDRIAALEDDEEDNPATNGTPTDPVRSGTRRKALRKRSSHHDR
jgi:hypothetical protein